jgi:hypothetical protein
MTARVIGQSGKSVEVATIEDVDGEAYTLPPAAPTVLGGVKKAATVADCTVAADGTSAGTQLNALIASLRAAGIIV